MRLLTNMLTLGISMLGLATAERTDDVGQFHKHKEFPAGVKDYKTGGPVTVHVCPHSHDDVGWLETVDQYFDASARDIQMTNVKVELTSIVEALWDHPERKFSEMEMKFFKMWWEKASPDLQQKVRTLIKNG